MIRGALILGVGFALGYVKAVQEQDDIAARYAELVDLIRKNEEGHQVTQPIKMRDAFDSTATETPEQDEEGDDVNE